MDSNTVKTSTASARMARSDVPNFLSATQIWVWWTLSI